MGMQHCVDDMLAVERKDTIRSAFLGWMKGTALLGWDVPAAKSPLPTQVGTVVGGLIDLRPVPFERPKIAITEKRLLALKKVLHRELLRNWWASWDFRALKFLGDTGAQKWVRTSGVPMNKGAIGIWR